MKKILVLSDKDKDSIEKWINRNYPEEDSRYIYWEDSISKLKNRDIRDYDVIVFTGTVGGMRLVDFFTVGDLWKRKVYINIDRENSTRKFMIQLRRIGAQIIGML